MSIPVWNQSNSHSHSLKPDNEKSQHLGKKSAGGFVLPKILENINFVLRF